jgi:hypothetical protein
MGARLVKIDQDVVGDVGTGRKSWILIIRTLVGDMILRSICNFE